MHIAALHTSACSAKNRSGSRNPKHEKEMENEMATSNSNNLEYCNKITNAAGRRVWGFFGIEAIARPNINGFSDVSERTYVPEDWR